ncbi:FAD-dependent oxidoreductase [Paraburkholderia phytofirmans]
MTSPRTFPCYQASSGWNALLPKRVTRREPPASKNFDTVIIGAGVTGLAAARRIAELEPSSSILLVDATEVGEGSSGRNSGFLINLPHNTGMSGHGNTTETARKQMALYTVGLKWLKSVIDRYEIDCGWNPAGKYHASATPDGHRRLLDSLDLYKDWGVAYRELGRRDLEQELGTLYYQYGYHSDTTVFVQPAALVRGLADNLPSNVHLWEGEAVLRIEKGSPHRVTTASMQLTSPRVIVANNGFARKLGFATDRLFTIYTYACLTPQLDEAELAKLGSVSEWGVIPANRLGSTLRKVASGRLMVRSGYSYEREQPLSQVRALLEKCYRSRYPFMKSHELEYVWGGVTALTRNGAVYFGRVADGMFVSVGCNGAGMLKGSVFGMLIGEMACGLQSPELADALGFQRPSWLPPEPIRRIAVLSAIHYQKRKAGLER